MISLDPLKPYSDLIRTGLFFAIVCGAFVVGCQRGEGNKEVELAKAQDRIDSLETSLTGFIDTFDQVNAAAKKAKDEAKAQQERADEALQRARQEADEYQTRLTLIQRDLDKAKRDPKCAEQLRQQLCVRLD